MRGSRIEHGLDPVQHGVSLERICLDPPHRITDLFGELPPIGASFVEVIAGLDGRVLLVRGTRLHDNHVDRGTVENCPADAARLIASALLRAADLSEMAASKLAARPEALAAAPAEHNRSAPVLGARR